MLTEVRLSRTNDLHVEVTLFRGPYRIAASWDTVEQRETDSVRFLAESRFFTPRPRMQFLLSAQGGASL